MENIYKLGDEVQLQDGGVWVSGHVVEVTESGIYYVATKSGAVHSRFARELKSCGGN